MKHWGNLVYRVITADAVGGDDFKMEKKLINYDKLIAYLEEKKKFYGELAKIQLTDTSIDAVDYGVTVTKWSVFTDLIDELETAPF